MGAGSLCRCPLAIPNPQLIKIKIKKANYYILKKNSHVCKLKALLIIFSGSRCVVISPSITAHSVLHWSTYVVNDGIYVTSHFTPRGYMERALSLSLSHETTITSPLAPPTNTGRSTWCEDPHSSSHKVITRGWEKKMNCRRKRSWSLLVLFSALMICEGFVKVESQHDYADALSKSILFFEGQRSGKLPSNQRMNWRKDSALEDGRQMGVSVRFPLSAFHFPRRVLLFFFSPLWFVKQTSGR